MAYFESDTFIDGVMAQSKGALTLWSKILKQARYSRVIELGTANGNFSLYLYLWCISRGSKFYTYDIKNDWGNGNRALKDLLNFKDHFYEVDIFEKKDEIIELIKKDGRTIIFCDNGNKIKEFQIFAPELKVGDLIAVHDWNMEIRDEDIRAICNEYHLEFAFLKETQEEGWTRVFQKMA